MSHPFRKPDSKCSPDNKLLSLPVLLPADGIYLKYHNIFAPVLKGLVSAAKALSGAVPDNQTLKTIAFVMSAALDGAQRAEELWLNGELDKEQRNHYAKLYIADVLEKAGIDVNDSINAMIDGFIAVACAIFPHGQTPKTKEEEK